MECATWLRRAGWLGLFAISAVSSPGSRADEAAAPPSEPAAAPEAEPARPPRPPREAPPPRPPRRPFAVRLPAYRLDVRLAPVSKALDQQLELKGAGVVVEHVGPEGPAAKAGIKENDIILAVGDKPIKEPSDLMDAVDASEGKELSLKLMRSGKPQTVTVTPAKPPEGTILGLPDGRDIEIDVEYFEKTIREKLKKAGVDMRMQIIKPGKFLPEGAVWSFDHKREFPDDLSVTIRKQGKNPAEIEVKKGDKTWNVKDNELAQLPEGVREPIESLLGHGPMRFNIVTPGPPHDGPPPPRGPGGDEVGPPPRHPDGPPGGPDRPSPRGRRPPGPPRAGEPGDRPDGPPPPGGPDGPRARRPGQPGERDGERGPRGRGGIERRLEELSRDLNRMRERLEGLREGLRDEDEDEVEIEIKE